jgi:hypothetical protein
MLALDFARRQVVDWLEVADEYADGETLNPEAVDSLLKTIDFYVMGSDS